MKRDPRLRPLGERRTARRLHGLRLTPGFQLAQRLASVYGLSFRPALFKRTLAAAAAHERAHARFVAHLKRTASIVAADLTEQLRQDGTLYGEARVVCDWSDAPTVERVPPEQWGRWPHVPLTDEQAARLDRGWGPSADELAPPPSAVVEEQVEKLGGWDAITQRRAAGLEDDGSHGAY